MEGNRYPAHLHTNGWPYANILLADVEKSTTNMTKSIAKEVESKYIEKQVKYIGL